MPTPSDTQNLHDLRERIREIDEQLLELIAKRLETARTIGDRKRELGLPVKDFQVEREVAQRHQESALRRGLDARLAEDLTRILIDHSVQAQDARSEDDPKLGSGRRILVVGGRGGMGAWLVDYFASFGHVPHVFDRDDDAQASDALERAASLADVIVLSTPISATAGLIARLAQARTQALVIDICSLKSPLIGAIAKAQAEGLRMASLHPMFGPGVRQLAGRNVIVCDVNDAAAAAEASSFFAATPLRILSIPLAEHDELMALVLGLSHLSNLAFAEALRLSGQKLSRLAEFASSTFRAQMAVTGPVTRDNQDLYFEIQTENTASFAAIAQLEEALAAYKSAIVAKDRNAFAELMGKGQRYLAGE